MGMSYVYAGSTSYPIFDRELLAVAKVFGGKMSDHTKERKETENERPLGYWLGFISSDESNEDKFVFPKDTDPVLVKWFNNIYSDAFTIEETEHVFELINSHPEIKEISSQIWSELAHLVSFKEPWGISL